MKKISLLFAVFFLFFVAHAQDSYVMFETMYIWPKTDKMEEFGEALMKHNKAYHSEGTSQVNIQYVANGKYGGSFVWVMGPLTFTDLDSRPSDLSHRQDWSEVMQYVDKTEHVEFWRRYDDISYIPEGENDRTKLLIRYFDVKPMKGKEFEELIGKVVEVYRKNELEESMVSYWSMFNTQNGRDFAAVFGFSDYAMFDDDMNFSEMYEEIYGEGSWMEFYTQLMELTDGMYEEVREMVPELSGPSE